MYELIDNHAHLDFEQFDDDRDAVIERCRDEGLVGVINAGARPDNNRRALDISREHPGYVHPTAGLHPTSIDAVGKDGLEETVSFIRDNQDELLAVGEIGLDYHHERTTEGRERQEEFFEPMLALAEELGMPVVIHSRDAEKRALEILESYDPPEVVMHCFNGNTTTVEESLDRGYWISVSTQVLYSTRVKAIVEETPVDRMLLETDAPFLYPDADRNEPWRITESLTEISDITDLPGADIAEAVMDATEQAYRHRFR